MRRMLKSIKDPDYRGEIMDLNKCDEMFELSLRCLKFNIYRLVIRFKKRMSWFIAIIYYFRRLNS